MSKKIFVSLPMRGRDDEVVKSRMDYLCKIYNKLNNSSYELIDTMFEEDVPEDTKHDCYYLGRAIAELSKADMVIFDVDWHDARGCRFEKWVCDVYDIPYIIGIDDNFIAEINKPKERKNTLFLGKW